MWKRLTDLRESKDLSRKELAALLHVSRNAIQSWESGDRVPPLPKLIELADFFGVSLDYLVGRERKDPPLVSDDDLRALEKAESILKRVHDKGPQK